MASLPHSHSLSLSLLSLHLLLSLTTATTSCYNPDGSIILDPEYQPCVQTLGAISMCCGTNRTINADVCLPNGLCQNPCTAAGQCGGGVTGQIWRESCTDASWNSDACLKGICGDKTTAGPGAAQNIGMTQCVTDGTWCCGSRLTSDQCCAMSSRAVLAATIGVAMANTSSSATVTTVTEPATTLSTSSSSTTAASSSTRAAMAGWPTAAPSSVAWPSSVGSAVPSSDGDRLGVGVGIGIGASAGFAIIAALVLFFLFRHRKRTVQRNVMRSIPYELEHDTKDKGFFFWKPSELPAKQARVVHEVSA